ncbi:MAG: EAL domain-containing protein [Pseudomonadales bacterium]|nr:EAL domain-containing protein [Pseudomonadales bacterium]
MRLLCVEPTRVFSQLLNSTFTDLDITTELYSLGADALERLSSSEQTKMEFDFITVSFYLEDMTAIELIKSIRNLSCYRYVPIVLITAESSEEILHRALGVGVTDIFQKDEIDSLVIFLHRFHRNKDPIDGRVLCIEDSIAQQQVMRAQLIHMGLSVDCCETIAQGWQLFQLNDYDLVITDIVFEKDLGGIKLINNIRRYPGDKGDVPILAMSAFDDPVRRIEILNRGANDYISKPVLEEELIARVRGLIANKKFIDAVKAEHEARDQERLRELRLLNVAMDTQEYVIFVDPEGKVIKANATFMDFAATSSEDLLKRSFLDFIPRGKTLLRDIWRQLNECEHWQGDIWLKGSRDQLALVQTKVTAIKDENNQMTKCVFVGVDVTKKRELEADLMHHQNYDQLTGLSNRDLFLELLAKDVSRSARLGFLGALLYVDLDNFKNINDSLGHHMGDALLKLVADRLQKALGSEDVVSRLGGDDFAIMRTEVGTDQNTAAESSRRFAQQIQRALAEPFYVSYQQQEQRIDTQGSIGIALYPQQQTNVYDILKQADAARYQAKSRGMGAIAFFSEDIQNEVDERARIENLLRYAIDNDEFYLNFQPIYQNENIIVGCEVLSRWRTNNGDEISPGLFIPIAENAGFMEAIGAWVIREALTVYQHWQQQGLPHTFKFMAINCSACQFAQESFVKDVQALVQEIGVAPDSIDLEITETLLMKDLVTVTHKMQALKNMGFRFAIDDFGTGFSSLRYLKQLPIDKLKIDQSFVRDIETNKSDLAIVETIIAMAHAMELAVVAEGVELQAQSSLLLERDCNTMQGYLFSRPVSATDCYRLIHMTSQSQSGVA